MTPGRLTFLGAGDSQGVPRWYCSCTVCEEARNTGSNRRARPAALLESDGGRAVLDAGPDLRESLGRAGVRALDAVVLTHAHNDHVLGLGDALDYVRWTGAPLRVLAPAPVLPALERRFGYAFRGPLRDRFEAIPPAGVDLLGWRVRAFEVPHGFNGTAHGLRLERAGLAVAYVPDAIGMAEELVDEWLRGLDLLVLGASFWHEDAPYASRSVYDVGEALALGNRARPRRMVLTHLGHGVDAAREPELPVGCGLARDGLTIELG